VISLVDAGAGSARGVLSIAVDGSGRRATLQYRPNNQIDHAVLINVVADESADRAGEWLVAPSVSVVRTSESWVVADHFRSELIDPWLQYRVEPRLAAGDEMHLPPEVLDPFVGTPPRRVRV